MSHEGRFLSICWVDSELHISTQQVEGREEFLATQIREDVVDSRQRVRILHGVCVQLSIVYAEPEGVFARIRLLFANYHYR